MESGAIAQTCYLYHIPFISFRIISDVPLKDTEASQYYNFWEQIAHDSFEVTKDFLQPRQLLATNERKRITQKLKTRKLKN